MAPYLNSLFNYALGIFVGYMIWGTKYRKLQRAVGDIISRSRNV